MLDIKAFLSSLTHHPGIYQMLGDDGEILYVGKARDLKNRVTSYFRSTQNDTKTQALMKHVKDVAITVTRSENEALLLECNLIKKLRPRYNVLFRDDKSYPYIRISNDHSYPRIDFYRGAVKKDALYFGPYPNSKAVREVIHLIQKIFQLRTCNDSFYTSRQRPCLQHQIGLCSGSCAGLISVEEYQQNVHYAVLFLQGKDQQILTELNKQMEKAATHLQYEIAAKLRDQIKQIREIQARQYISANEGDIDIIGLALSAGIACIQLLTMRGGKILGSRSYFPSLPPNAGAEEILTAFITQYYLGVNRHHHEIPKEILTEIALPEQSWLEEVLSEQAKHKVVLSFSVRGERKKWQEMADTNAKQSVASYLINKANTKERFSALQALLNFNELPKRIECFDISHSMGEATVASCVVFNINGPMKSDYRRFNITDITGGDDIAAMRQALLRRYKRLQLDEQKLPDILLIDGGIPQMNAALAILVELNITQMLVIGVAKGEGRKPGLETLHRPDHPPLHLSSDSLALHLIQQIRDEAHRFAITGHRLRRDKTRKTSTLESIPGIGAKRRRELLRYFGGIQALNRASLEELAKVPGISQSLAHRIFETLHDVVV
jgi:excinuclease ABC subunit C